MGSIVQRRFDSRLTVDGPLAGLLTMEGAPDAIECEPFEVSNGGLGILTAKPLSPGTKLWFRPRHAQAGAGVIRLLVKYCFRDNHQRRSFRCGLESLDTKIDFFGARGGLSIVPREAFSVRGQSPGGDTTLRRAISRTDAAVHDARNFLFVARSATELLTMESSIERSESIAALANRIIKAIDQIGHCVDEIQDDQLCADGEPWRSVVVKDLVVDAVAFCRGFAEQADVSLSVVVKASKARIFGKPSALMRLLINLLMNAKEAAAAADKKWIRVEVNKSKGRVLVRVVDSGALDKAARETIFAPFFSTKSANPRRPTGIGLAYVRAIVEYHGGKILVDPAAEATTFLIELPLESEGGT